MIISTDIETYVEYIGNNAEEILTNNELLQKAGITTEKQLELGRYYPILNAQKYVLGVVYISDDLHYTYTNPEDHWNKIIDIHEACKKKNEKLYIYGHNHLYDLIGYGGKQILKNEKLKIVIEQPLLAIYDEKRNKQSQIEHATYFTDTMFYWRMKLEEIGEIIGIQKKEMPISFYDTRKLEEYCIQDCKITLESIKYIQKILSEIGFKPRKFLTAGTTAQSTWQTYVKKSGEYNEIAYHGKIYKSEHWKETKMALRGGDIRTFHTGEYPELYKLDIRGEYAYIMKTMRFPNLRTALMIKKPEKELWNKILKLIGVIRCEVDIHVEQDKIPFLPIHYKKRQYRPYKIRCKGTWTIEEIKYAKEIGQITIKHIEWAEVYKDAKNNPFKEYIEKLEDIEILKPQYKPVIKLLRNNLFGKFSQHKEIKDTKLIYRGEIQEYLDNGWEVKGVQGPLYYIEKTKGEYEPSYSNPMISALITAGGRILLHKEMSKSKKVYNCNTDGFIIGKEDVKNYYLFGNAYGTIKLEEYGPTKILENKYKINDKIVISGIPKRNVTEDILNKETIETNKMITIKDALMRNEWEKLGTFKTETQKVNQQDKMRIEDLPNYIDETKEYVY